MKRRESVGYQVNHLSRLLAQALRIRISPYGTVPGQFAQLLALYEQDGITQQQLCEQVKIDQSTMAHTLQRMERDGLIERTPDPDDRRRALIVLTDRARELEGSLAREALAVNAQATSGFTDGEVATYLELSARMIDNLESATTGEHGDG